VAPYPREPAEVAIKFIEINAHTAHAIGAGNPWSVLVNGHDVVAFQCCDAGQHVAKSILQSIADPKVIAVTDDDGGAHVAVLSV